MIIKLYTKRCLYSQLAKKINFNNKTDWQLKKIGYRKKMQKPWRQGRTLAPLKGLRACPR